MPRLYFVRHGHTEFTESRRYCGSTDVSLSERGRAEASTLTHYFSTRPLDVVVASPMRRCLETAEFFASGPSTIDALRELDFGHWEGLAFEEAAEQFPTDTESFLAQPAQFTFPGGDSIAAFQNRVASAAESLRCTPGDTAVVAHGGSLRALMTALGVMSPEAMLGTLVEPCSVSTIEVADGVCTLEKLNDTRHLEGVSV